MEVRDVTGGNRVFSIGNNGAISSSSFFTAFEGLGSQVQMGQMTGGFAGIAFGNGTPDVRLSKTATGVLRMNVGRALGLPSSTTAARPAASDAPQSIYWDTTVSKLVFSDGTTWKELTIGAAV